MTHDYDNSATQAEKRQVLKDTYLARAEADADLAAQGRFKRETATRVTAVPEYPKQPANSFWSHDPVPATEPLGFSVNAMEPVGTPNEIQSSIEPVPIPVTASPTKVDRTEEPAVDVANFPAALAAGSRSMKRRVW